MFYWVLLVGVVTFGSVDIFISRASVSFYGVSQAHPVVLCVADDYVHRAHYNILL